MAVSQSGIDSPEVAIVGWIPKIPPTTNSLPSAYALSPSPWIFAMQALFASGNPPPAINSYSDFQNLVASKEFRIAIALRDLHVDWDKIPGEGAVKYRPEIYLGYTPLTIWIPGRRGWSSRTIRHSPGVGSANMLETVNTNSCTVRLYARFKLAGWLNAIQAVLTRHLAPSAIVDLQYTVFEDGNIEINFSGSLLPSQNFYVDWQLVNSSDMQTNNNQEVRDFVTAGNCTDAPAYRIYRFVR
jgi:hypothetical protein